MNRKLLPKLEQIKAADIGGCMFLSKYRPYGLTAREMLNACMASNMPALFPMLRLWIIILLCVLTCITAQAHPGHEGGHDGDEFVWTADHLARHPVATLLILAAVALIAWGATRFFSATQRQIKAAAARTQAADKTV